MPYTVAEELFLTKKALTERAQEILARTPDGLSVTEADCEFLFALFQYHDEWAEKSAGGVCGITTQKTVHGTRCFILCKHDDHQIDISFPHAIRLIPSTRTTDLLPQQLRDFKSAARFAIRTQVHVFRDQALLQPRQCPITGERLTRSNAAVDHAPPLTFDELVFMFCRETGVNPLEVKISSEGGVVAVFEDTDLMSRWQAVHQAQANLRLISRVANLQLPKPRVLWSELWS